MNQQAGTTPNLKHRVITNEEFSNVAFAAALGAANAVKNESDRESKRRAGKTVLRALKVALRE